ncbi:YbhB/YbcL family Raf kinase inhibitor-like protein [Apilactobacillus sp. TMW 2.2459]|uniref:YbhB/YbcL family Raf kinase inhibitor-like protein n=1 Tax=Apilactobacillus xinyiensis TaxID=2841032 RepID=A0ABT0I232_9LACO|nr:YbhB/YbcL family Raf kinase inhibitor-like protein [Apilactobacillus xinyiensis]MCK8624785.1 YbhB/YbcL family Raf kinase inhibitor-like protein [Apilactobacillus xinyiensis]MCL0312182.1 YbhB/YbcL family Raf kinase inhibitor-like protein [Apilactobacillus xinyiensis]
MKINVPTMTNGYLDDKYTKHTSAVNQTDGSPFISFPINITDVPENAKYLAFTLTDLDSIPVCGFEWIHWVAANIPADCTNIPEDAGRNNPFKWTRGYNSLAGGMLNKRDNPISAGYVGPTPPDKTHYYTLTVYALDAKLPLHDGFWYNELIHTMQGQLLEKSSITLPVKA